MKNPGPNTTPQIKQRVASAVHFHTLFQMSINHVVLWGLFDLDKLVQIDCIEDEDGNPQDLI